MLTTSASDWDELIQLDKDLEAAHRKAMELLVRLYREEIGSEDCMLAIHAEDNARIRWQTKLDGMMGSQIVL